MAYVGGTLLLHSTLGYIFGGGKNSRVSHSLGLGGFFLSWGVQGKTWHLFTPAPRTLFLPVWVRDERHATVRLHALPGGFFLVKSV